MQKSLITFLVLWCLSFFTFGSPYKLSGTVIEVLDGDTIKLKSDQIYKIRLAFIDAPELSQKHGVVSKNSLSMLTLNKKVIADCTENDQYGRDVCIVKVDSISVNETQISRGLAWAYRQYLPKNSNYIALEETAKKNKLRIWGDANPTPPWVFRKESSK